MVIQHAVEKVQDKFFNKTKATRGRKLECTYSTGCWTTSSMTHCAHCLWTSRYNIDIAAFSETILHDEGSLVEMGTGYTFFWSGLPTVARRIHDVGFAVRTALLQSTQESPIAIDERLMTLRLPLAKNRLATFVSVYSPMSDSSDNVKNRFYETLYSILRSISQNDKIILLGDFNAKVGRIHDTWHRVIGHHGVGNMNSSGLRLLFLCS